MSDYDNLINLIEKNRLDWEKGKGNLFIINFKKTIDPFSLYQLLKNNRPFFKMLIFPLYKQENFHLFDCMDLHTAGRFKLQIFPNKLYINLKSDSRGDLILRLFSNLQSYFSPNLQLKIDNRKEPLIPF
jgi:hypothetical protein